jgi:type VI secretion system protein
VLPSFGLADLEVSGVGREQTLLDRMAAMHAEPGAGSARAGAASGRYAATAAEDLEGLMESIRRHLVRLLNARHGMSEAVPDYGLPALADIMAGSADYIARVLEAIRTAIEKYEPRLRRVRVTHQATEGNRQTLVFRIDAVMVGRSGEHRVWYETALAPTGELQVSG